MQHAYVVMKKKRMFLGDGRFNFKTVANFPYFCEKCNEIMVHNVFKKPEQCRCGQMMVRYDDECLSQKNSKLSNIFSWNIGAEILILSENDYMCPQCKEYLLKWSRVGLWD